MSIKNLTATIFLSSMALTSSYAYSDTFNKKNNNNATYVSSDTIIQKKDSLINNDAFIKTKTEDITEPKVDIFKDSPITPLGVKDKSVLKNAPKPDVVIAGENKKAGIVVDLSTNTLYRYDKDGNPVNAYLIASGKLSGKEPTPTEKGVRIVKNIEKYPYKDAPAITKRRKNPKNYGPYALILEKIDTKTGEQSKTGEFIHGCKSYYDTFEATKNRYVSGGCMRMENSVITALSKDVKKGELVIIK